MQDKPRRIDERVTSPPPAEPGYGLPPLLTVAETAEFLRIGKSQLYERLRSDPDFKGVYVPWGRSYRIRRDRLLTLLEGVDDDAS